MSITIWAQNLKQKNNIVLVSFYKVKVIPKIAFVCCSRLSLLYIVPQNKTIKNGQFTV